MKINRKFMSALCIAAIGASTLLFTGCGNSEESSSGASSDEIHVVSREDGSGTREAFSEITKLIVKDGDKKTDNTVKDAIIQNSTESVMSTVSTDKDAIGYISLGSLNDKVKALKLDGVEATDANIKADKYALARPFLVAYKESPDKVTQDFLNYLLSDQGQEIVAKNGYIALEGKGKYEPSKLKGHIAVSGSTSVTPLMEKIVEQYESLNPDITIDIQSNGSSAGITDTINGGANIGMSSRNLKDDEKAKLKEEKIAIDGIAVIVNKENKLDNISLQQLNEVYTGKIKEWSKLAQ
ncbi:substrate-binding domain-containing protein [Peptostreptococcus russellii]|uniref:substrate-binding domain-containing protein n=1 Tax=Peptostreptococcus russellii TaxID=215200 RepID=UPI0026EDAA76|nr:substrate-binding domain-containing protein [Peptostreptococcus russellii]